MGIRLPAAELDALTPEDVEKLRAALATYEDIIRRGLRDLSADGSLLRGQVRELGRVARQEVERILEGGGSTRTLAASVINFAR